jgi:hypothetical protein
MPAPRPEGAPTAVATAAFSVPAEAVWRYRLDFSNLSEYNPDVSDVERIAEGAPDAVGGALGPVARYAFGLADARRPGTSHRVELWIVEVEEPTLVTAGMSGASDAYEEFVVTPLDAGRCEATLNLWLLLPDGIDERVLAAAAAGALAQIEKEVRLMKEVLEGRVAS